jgi:hypothetical protein
LCAAQFRDKKNRYCTGKSQRNALQAHLAVREHPARRRDPAAAAAAAITATRPRSASF